MKYNHFSMLPEKAFQPRNGRFGMTLEGGGGGQQQVSQQTNQLPEYAKPYVERMIGRGEALTTAPYQTYGGERIAQTAPGQLAARQEVAGLTRPGQFQTGADYLSQAGQAGLAAGQYQPGVFAAPLTEAARLRRYQAAGPAEVQGGLGSFTAPGTAQQFMSPYMQNVVDVQQREAIRAAQQGQLGANLAAARQGTYGGARQMLAQTERERNLQEQLGRIQATGSQAAYDAAQRAFEAEQARGLQAGLQTQQLGTQTGLQNLQALLGVQQLGAQQGLESQRLNQQALMEAQRMAEQSRQFGTTAGLQGAQAATQAGLGLGQLGTSQQAADLQRLQAQESAAGLGRAEQQARLDLAYQDFLAQQRHPYAQLGFMSDLLRGTSPLAAQGGRTVYEAPPSLGGQLLGAGANLLGGYMGATGKIPFMREGGEVKGYAEGGEVKGYATGGLPNIIENAIDVEKLNPEQIEGMRATKVRPDVPDIMLLAELDKKLEELQRFKAQGGIPQTNVVEDIRAQAAQESAGLNAIPIADNYYRSEEEVAEMAGGGIVAFANGGRAQDYEGGVDYADGSKGYLLGGLLGGAARIAGTFAPATPSALLTAARSGLPAASSAAPAAAASSRIPSWLGGGAGDKAILGTAMGAGRGALGLAKSALKNPLTTAGVGGAGLAYMLADSDEEEKKEGAKSEPAKKEEKPAVTKQDVARVQKAEDAYEKALKQELDKTDLSDEDRIKALGFSLMKMGAKAMQAKRGEEGKKIGEGIEVGVDNYVNTLQQARKDKRQLTKDLAEYGLAKERNRIYEQSALAQLGQAEASMVRAERTGAQAERTALIKAWQDEMKTTAQKDRLPFPLWLQSQGFGGASAGATAEGRGPYNPNEFRLR